MTFYLGVDGGGSHCRAQLEDASGKLLGQAITGPANLVTMGQGALQNIEQAIALAIEDAGSSYRKADYGNTKAVLGLAGFNMAIGRDVAHSWQAPFSQTFLTSDMHIACAGAHAGEDGAIIIVGTGSAAFVQHKGEITALGGYGLSLGDHASGAHLGLQAVQYTLQMFDGLLPRCDFLEAILAKTNCASAEQLFQQYHAAQPAQFAQLTPLIFRHAEQGSGLANHLIQTACDYLASLIQRLIDQGTSRIALTGGMAQAITPYIASNLQHYLTEPTHTPLAGSLLLARRKQDW